MEENKENIEQKENMENTESKPQKNKFLKGYLCGTIFALLIVFVTLTIRNNIYGLAGINALGNAGSKGDNTTVLSGNVSKKLDAIQKIINAYFLEEADKEALVNGMYAGYIEGLDDPYSVYYTEEEFQKMMESTNGTYCGIGVTVSQNPQTGIITLVKPFEGSPGEEAGILPGDILYKVNGEEVTGEDLSAVVLKIKGEEGTTVDLTVAREGENDYIDITVERRKIEVPTISHTMLDNNIGYIIISEFDDVTSGQFKTALEDLNAKGMKGLVVDLRNNPGGVLDVVVDMLDRILPEGMIVYTEDKYGNREEYKSDAKTQLNVPLAVLVNKNSASASEIFAGAVKDYGVGTIVGTTTFGKGIVQRLFELGDGTAMKLTISKYYTPNGNNIHGKGIEPDVEVELDESLSNKITIGTEEDNQLQKALEIINSQINN